MKALSAILFPKRKARKTLKDRSAPQNDENNDNVANDAPVFNLPTKESFETSTLGDDKSRMSALTERNIGIARMDSLLVDAPERKVTRNLHDLLENNKYWAAQKVRMDPQFFQRLSSQQQQPNYLWIGCSDSRVPANQIVNMPPGEIFVHRNVANIVNDDDKNALAVIQYAVENLKVKHIIVCGHTCCGGVRACFGPQLPEPLEGWLGPVRQLREKHAAKLDELTDENERWRFLCEENVRAQIAVLEKLPIIRKAWENKQPLALHGWLYYMNEGLLQDLKVTLDNGYFPDQGEIEPQPMSSKPATPRESSADALQ